MKPIDEGKRVLLRAEEALRKLVAQAANEGQYDAVVILADWAKVVNEIAKNDHDAPASTFKSQNGSAAVSTGGTTSRAKTYPQFFRDTDCLIKVAWSKSSKAEYEHKAAFTIVRQLSSALVRASSRNQLLSMDHVLPLRDDDGEEVPSYQSYLCLGWLKKLGIVRQHGRQGYSIKPDCDVEWEVDRAWKVLGTRIKK